MNMGFKVNMERCAIYARYSDEQQRATSIEDQVRRCKAFAEQYSISLENVLIFKDAAITGRASGEARRGGFNSLLEAWDDNEFTVLIVDEFSRLSRDGVTQANLIRKLENNQRVRMLTANGVDTSRPNWQLLLGIEGVVSQQAGRDSRHRVVRGMLGQLERGYMIATPPFGYSLKRELDGQGNHIGSNWLIDETEATIVQEIFERRGSGESMHEISRWLNDAGIPTRRRARNDDGGFWRPSAIRNLLQNFIYKGVFVWNGSSTAKTRAKKAGREIEQQFFLRPALRLVNDDLWLRCNENRVSRSGYGGGKHALAGLLSCSCCGRTLSISSGRTRSLYCANCSICKGVLSGDDQRLTATVACAGVEVLIVKALKLFLTDEVVDSFRFELEARLRGGGESELSEARSELAQLLRSQERISRFLVAAEAEDAVLEKRYEEARDAAVAKRAELAAMEAGRVAWDVEAIRAQVAVADPAAVVEQIFASDLKASHLRAILSRLFPAIVFEGKDRTHRSYFRLRFVPGAALAVATDSPCLEGEEYEGRFELNYEPLHGRLNQPKWSVRRISLRRIESGELLAGTSVVRL